MKTYRTSLEKHNAPYRGVSKRSDYVNFNLAVSHDLLHVFNVSGGNPEIHGHKDDASDLMSSIINGDRNITQAEYTAGTIKKVTEELTKLSDLNNWTIPSMTYGQIEKHGNDEWKLIPPETERGFFELEHLLHVQAGDKLLIRFKPKNWNPNTAYRFGALNFDSAGDSFKRLEVDEFNSFSELSNKYFEYILRFDEERDVRLAIQSVNSINGTLGAEPLTLEQFGIYYIEEVDVYTRSLEEDMKPILQDSLYKLKHLEERRI